MLSQVTGKKLQSFPFKMGRLVRSWELKTGHLNLSGWPANGTRYSRVPKTSMGNEWVVI